MSDFPEISSIGIHGDDMHNAVQDVAPPIRVSTTFEYEADLNPDATSPELWYSRISHPTATRTEAVLSGIIGKPTLVFASGLAAFHAAIFGINPKTVFTAHPSYHGCHGILDMLTRNYGLKVEDIDADPNLLQPGDVIHLETPVNPAGTARDIEHYAKIAHSRKALLVVDATFAPPPVSDPFKHGADVVLHSATKYFGGHSDVLAGTLSFVDQALHDRTAEDRGLLGSILAPVESWTLLRSLRTYSLRVERQVQNANKIVQYLHSHIDELPLLQQVQHSSLQTEAFIKIQLPIGGPPTFSFLCTSEEAAKAVPTKVKYFHHCTSLGGIESMLEWRIISDKTADRRLIRVSVGGENVEDLIQDLVNALK